MKFTEKFAACLSIWFLIASVGGDPSVCYYCTTDADGVACNAPINANAIRVQHCGNLTVTENTGNVIEDTGSSTNGIFACTTLTYVSNVNTFVTIRECQNRQIQGVEICNFLRESYATVSYARQFTCETCFTNMCNSSSDGTILHLSFVTVIGLLMVKIWV